MKVFIFTFLLSLLVISCSDEKYEITQVYSVSGTRTDVKINYTGEDGENTAITVDTLPWTTNVTLRGSKNRNREWFLSATSSEIGSLAIQIGAERFTVLNASGKIASNYTESSAMIWTILIE